MADHTSQKSLTEQREQRIKNLNSLVERGFEAYPYSFRTTHQALELQETYKDARAEENFPDQKVTIAGRAMTVRMMGKVTFYYPTRL